MINWTQTFRGQFLQFWRNLVFLLVFWGLNGSLTCLTGSDVKLKAFCLPVGGCYLSRKPPQHLLLSPPHLRCPWTASSAASCIIPTAASSQGIMGKGHGLNIWKGKKNWTCFLLFFSLNTTSGQNSFPFVWLPSPALTRFLDMVLWILAFIPAWLHGFFQEAGGFVLLGRRLITPASQDDPLAAWWIVAPLSWARVLLRACDTHSCQQITALPLPSLPPASHPLNPASACQGQGSNKMFGL